jgi:hypothetical protein
VHGDIGSVNNAVLETAFKSLFKLGGFIKAITTIGSPPVLPTVFVISKPFLRSRFAALIAWAIIGNMELLKKYTCGNVVPLCNMEHRIIKKHTYGNMVALSNVVALPFVKSYFFSTG